jgi:hypothetical protein
MMNIASLGGSVKAAVDAGSQFHSTCEILPDRLHGVPA